MAIDEDLINAALNTPTDDLENEPEDQDYPDDDNEPVDDPDDDNEPVDDPDEDANALLDIDDNPEPAPKPNRVQKLANERREEREKRERAEREVADLRSRLQQQDTDRLTRAQEERQRMLDEMDPTDRRLYLAEQEARQARFEAADNRDLSTFAVIVQQHPQMKGLATEVEEELVRARAVGQNPSRQQVAQFLLGQRAWKALQEGPKKAKAAKQRVDAARGRPVGASSNAQPARAASGKGDTSADREKRLMNVKL